MRHAAVALGLACALASPAVAIAGRAAMAAPTASVAVARMTPEQRDRFVAAMASLTTGDASKAAREFGDPIWATTPVPDYAALFLAQSLVKTGDQAGARAAATKAVDGAPDGRPMPSMLLQAASVLSSAGDEAGAGALYRKFVDRYPDSPDAPRARYAIALGLLSESKLPEAARAFGDVWLLSPSSPLAADAARQLRVIEQGRPGVFQPTQKERIERAERLLSAGLGDTAKIEAEALLDSGLAPDLAARAYRVVAESSRRAGKADVAAATINRALADLPADRRAPWLLDLARLVQKKDRAQSLATVDKIVRDHPKSPEAAEALGLKARLLESAGRAADAEAVYQKLAADYAEQEEGGAAIWRLGWIAWFKGNYADAASRWQRLASVRGGQPHREAATYWIGRALDQRGEAENAAKQYASVLADGPRSYYGILASRRSTSPRATTAALSLPADAREVLEGDQRYARVEALRGVGLGGFADEEMDELTRRSLGDPKRLYALSAAWVQDSRYHMALRILRRHFQPFARSGLATLPRTFWEMYYPIGWRAEMAEAAGRASIDPLLVAAVVREESSYHPQARSRVGARGLMQLMPDTARPMAQARKLAFNNGDVLDDPAANLDMGAGYLAGLLQQFGDARLAVAAYNAGPTRVREWWTARRSDDLEVFVEQIPFNETRAFVKRVMLSWDEYRRLYAAAAAPEPAPVAPIPTAVKP